MATFQFYRFRFHFRAVDRICFPPGKLSNAIRGAFGAALHLQSPETFRRLFDAESAAPSTASGLADPPRPFVLRASGLDGRTIAAGQSFSFDAHVFAVQEEILPHFRTAFTDLPIGGGRAVLDRIDQLDLNDRARPGPPCTIELDGREECQGVVLRFVTPTELKSDGRLVPQPEFGVLFNRLRDRFSALRALYGPGPLEVDFRGLGSRAKLVRLVRCDLRWETATRRSARTGQVHPIGGFTGEAEYEGQLGEFMPWLRAARWVGVGRQTVWGKGDLRVVE